MSERHDACTLARRFSEAVGRSVLRAPRPRLVRHHVRRALWLTTLLGAGSCNLTTSISATACTATAPVLDCTVVDVRFASTTVANVIALGQRRSSSFGIGQIMTLVRVDTGLITVSGAAFGGDLTLTLSTHERSPSGAVSGSIVSSQGPVFGAVLGCTIRYSLPAGLFLAEPFAFTFRVAAGTGTRC